MELVGTDAGIVICHNCFPRMEDDERIFVRIGGGERVIDAGLNPTGGLNGITCFGVEGCLDVLVE